MQIPWAKNHSFDLAILLLSGACTPNNDNNYKRVKITAGKNEQNSQSQPYTSMYNSTI